VGWFSFTCCEDSTILFTELLNDHLHEWKKMVEFRHMKALKTNNSLTGLDVAFIEGAISSDSQAREAQQIRENAKYVVAIGACACTGQPSTSRNRFASEQINERIRWYLSHFDYGKEVKSLGEVTVLQVRWRRLLPSCSSSRSWCSKRISQMAALGWPYWALMLLLGLLVPQLVLITGRLKVGAKD
jgi:hypothetical protein